MRINIFNTVSLHIEETVTISKKEYDGLKEQLSAALKLIVELQAEIKLLKNGRNSNTSSTPSSQDYGAGRKVNLREKTNRKSGGQKGHKGRSLKMSPTPGQIVEHRPGYCNHCGNAFGQDSVFELHQRKQEVVIPPIEPKHIEHRSFRCRCGNCGLDTVSQLPPHLKGNVQYGKDIEALIGYLSVYQYMPSDRMRSFFKDIMNLPISEGTIYNLLASMGKKVGPVHEQLRGKVSRSEVVGGDESGMKVNGDKAWFWTFQTQLCTYIKAAYSRGYKTIEETFADGFPMSVYVSDSLPAQLKIPTKAKQLCLAHLMRELKNFESALDCGWATEVKRLFKEAIECKREMTTGDYTAGNPVVMELENRLSQLLEAGSPKDNKKIKAFTNRLKKHRSSIFTFLYHREVPPGNNASERAIRNAKLKMKISNQFKSFEFANYYAAIRSVIDTTIKNSNNVFSALRHLVEQPIPVAE